MGAGREFLNSRFAPFCEGNAMSKSIVICAILVLGWFVILSPGPLTAATAANNLYFPSAPALSPDGEKLVFSYDEDLWIVPSKGGTAYRLTAMEGRETFPRFSPDGQWLAFSASPLGNLDVYVMPAEGGEIRRLTYHSSDDRVDSWSWDGQYIYFNSSRANDFTGYKVAITGGTPQRIFSHYFNRAHGIVEHPQEGALYFTDSWESMRFANRKRYKGDFNPDIKSYHTTSGKYTVHTNYRGKDFAPTIDRQGKIYFISDRFQDEYNLFTFNEKHEVTRLTNFSTSIYAPCVSANGNLIAFVKDYQLFTYDVQTAKVTQIPIRLFEYNALSFESDFNLKGKVTAFDISADGEKIACVSRGELFVSSIDGKTIRQLETSAMGRVMEVKWLKDNRTLIFTQTVDGWLNIFRIRADRRAPAVQLTFDQANNRYLSLDANRSQALYLSGRNQLRIIDLETFTSRTVVEDEFWGYYNSRPHFSPGNQYILYTLYREFEQDICLYDLKKGQTINLTESGVTEMNPTWSPDGKYIFFSADRYFPSYPRGGDNNKIYRLGLQKYDQEFKQKKYDNLFKEEKKDKGKKAKEKKRKEKGAGIQPTLNIDFEDMTWRWEQISPDAGAQDVPYVISNGDGYRVFYLSNHDGEKYNIWQTTLEPFAAPKTTKIKGAISESLDICTAKDKTYVLVNGIIQVLDGEKNVLKPIKMDYTFRRNLADEFKQMFIEVWANLQENYYDEKFHNVDWEQIGQRYQEYVPYVRKRSDLRRLLIDMLGELGSSHLGFTSDGEEEKTFHKTTSMHTGIRFEPGHPYRVASIIPMSAADKQGISLEAGDRLIAVNDQPIDPKQNREYYFAAPSLDQELKLSFLRGKKQIVVYIHPGDNQDYKSLLYDEWIRENHDYVDRKSNHRIAYLHMKDMGGNELKKFIIGMTTEAYKKDALILDLRYNRGGNVHDDVLNFLSQRPYTKWKYRGGKFAPQPNFAPAVKPIVLLINEQSLSDAEMTAAGFKELKLGKIIGTESYRWLIFTSGKNLVDGSFYRLPSWGCYTLDGRDIERHGVTPDIRVDCTLKDRLDGKHPQLDKAITEIITQLNNK